MLGWRKLSAWFLVYGFAVVATLVVKTEIQTNNMEMVKWVTGIFFGANAVKPLFQKVPLVEFVSKAMNTGGGGGVDEEKP